MRSVQFGKPKSHNVKKCPVTRQKCLFIVFKLDTFEQVCPGAGQICPIKGAVFAKRGALGLNYIALWPTFCFLKNAIINKLDESAVFELTHCPDDEHYRGSCSNVRRCSDIELGVASNIERKSAGWLLRDHHK